MAVYVDNARNKYGRMLMCHMIADTEKELHEMADRIGIARKHFQRFSFPHYDICQQYRQRAINAGAIEKTTRELIHVIKALRNPRLGV